MRSRDALRMLADTLAEEGYVMDAMLVGRAASDLDAVSALADELAERGVTFSVANQSWRANVYTEIAAKLRGILEHLATHPTT